MKRRSLRDYLEEDEEVEISSNEEVMEVLHDIITRLEKIEVKLELIERKLDDLEAVVAREGSKRTREPKGTGSIMEVVMEKLQQQGYLSVAKELFSLKKRDQVIERLKRMGAIEIDLGDDKYLVHPRSYRIFIEKLSEIHTRDPFEAGEKLGELKPLFLELVKKGLVYFDAKEKKWKRL